MKLRTLRPQFGFNPRAHLPGPPRPAPAVADLDMDARTHYRDWERDSEHSNPAVSRILRTDAIPSRPEAEQIAEELIYQQQAALSVDTNRKTGILQLEARRPFNRLAVSCLLASDSYTPAAPAPAFFLSVGFGSVGVGTGAVLPWTQIPPDLLSGSMYVEPEQGVWARGWATWEFGTCIRPVYLLPVFPVAPSATVYVQVRVTQSYVTRGRAASSGGGCGGACGCHG